MVVEVMGRYAGWIALHSGVAGGADVILIPEIPYDLEKVAACIRDRDALGARFSIVVVAEGAQPEGRRRVADRGGARRPRGAAWRRRHVAAPTQLEELTGKETRHVVLGHLQRGGSPTAFDRTLATRFGGKAVELLMQRAVREDGGEPSARPRADPARRSRGQDEDRAARLRPAADRSRAGRVVRRLSRGDVTCIAA